MSYEYIKELKKGDYTIDNAILFSFPEEDLTIIKDDWHKIMQKIKTGRAHEISESDTLYLAACTKGATAAKSLRKQPFSTELAKQRAYSLKQSYMSYVLNTYIFGNKNDPNIIKDISELHNQTFEEYVISKINPFIGKTQEELKTNFSIAGNMKNINEVIIARMLGISGRITDTAEFKKANIVPKTIRVNANGSITESMSFPHKYFKNIWEEKWEESSFREYLTQTKFLFVIFQYDNSHNLILKEIKFWNISDTDLLEVEKVWKQAQQTLIEGVELVKHNGKTHNNLPKSSENPVCHVRPHGRNANDVMKLPDGRYMAKQCFWFNNSYIEKQI